MIMMRKVIVMIFYFVLANKNQGAVFPVWINLT